MHHTAELTVTSAGLSVTPGPGAPVHAALPGSLAADLSAGSHPTTLLFPGIDGRWPQLLASALVGRPELATWVRDVLAELDAWTRTAPVRATGAFADGFSHLVTDDPAAPVPATAATGPMVLVGNVLTNLVSLAALEAEGLDLGTAQVRAAGHSAGLLAAWAAAGERGEDGLVRVGDAAQVAKVAALLGVHAATHGWSVSDSAVAVALAGDEHAVTPMVAVSGPRTGRLAELLAARENSSVRIGVINSRKRHVLTGRPTDLQQLRHDLIALAQSEATRRAKGRQGGAPFRFAWEPLPSAVPFHHPALTGAAQAATAQLHELGVTLPGGGRFPVIDPATGAELGGTDLVEQVATSILVRAHDWRSTLVDTVPVGGVAVFVSPLGSLAGVSASVLRGRGALVVDPASPAGREALFTPGGGPTVPDTYDRFAPAVVRSADGTLRLANRHTALTGRSPMILPGMTPSTAEAPIVAAAANGGHVAELAGGGQVSERIFTERVTELTELLQPGQEVVLNAMYLDPYLWGLHVGRERLVLKARAAGAPFCGVTISAGIPDKSEALALLDELVGAGLWLNAFKPGTAAQVAEVLAIAADTPHTVWIHLEGGAAGGHHSWEDLDELLLATYHLVREHPNVVLAVGGGIADPQRAAALLTGTWAHTYDAPTMPVDAVLLGTVSMATLESAASASVKAALATAPGHAGWVGRGQVAGGTTSGRSGLDADIHFLDNSAARAAALLDSVAGDADKVAELRAEIIEALARTAKPYFGDVAEMTYRGLLDRFVGLTALGRSGRYEDGRWLDPSHRSRFVALLQQAEARLSPQDSGQIPTRFADPASVDDPEAAIAALLADHPSAATALVHPADVAHFLTVCRQPGKPVPFVPVIDADVRRWYQSDSLWQSHSDRYDADQVLIIPGPAAVAGLTVVDEPVADLLDRFEHGVAATLDVDGAIARTVPFRLGRWSDQDLDPAAALIGAALTAPTWRWLGASRTNPLHAIGPVDSWVRTGDRATWTGAGADSALLRVQSDGTLRLVVAWPDLGVVGDGRLTIPVEVTTQAGTVTFEVTETGLANAGDALLTMFSNGTGGPQDPPALLAAHAATVGAALALPDRVMTRLWPGVFGALRQAGLASSIFDLVHLRHELRPAGDALDPVVSTPEVSRTDGGLVVTVTASADGAQVLDRFFVRRAVVDPTLPEAQAPAAADSVATPVRTLGTLTVTAPTSLDVFATVSGDANPIHRSDVVARLVGLPGRIVHGMWTSAAATRAVIELAADGDPERLRSWSVDFVAPVLPGQVVDLVVTRVGLRAGARVVTVTASTSEGTVAIGTAEIAAPRTAYVFPGQGIQSQGMGMDGYARSAAAREVWTRADRITREALDFSILQIVRDNPAVLSAGGQVYRHPSGVLFLTQFTQVAMATLAAAQVAELREAGAFDDGAALAGHSVGEYNALAACAGVIPLEAVLQLVFARGQAMHGLVPRDADGASDYRLAVVRPHIAGLSHAQAEALVASVAADTGQLCEIVNHNLRGKQYAVAGTAGALAELADRLGVGAPGRPPLVEVPGIDVPFHSSALRGGVDEFRWHLLDKLPQRIDPERLVGRYVPNLYPVAFRVDRDYVEGVHEVCRSGVLAEILADWDRASADVEALARTLLIELLAWQFASPVRWIETFELLCAPADEGGLDVRRVVEIGVGTAPTLANLAKGSLALSGHRGSRPQVVNVEVDADVVFERDADPLPVAEPEADDVSVVVEATVPTPAAPAPASSSAGPAGGPTPDLPVDHATALTALLALRVGVRVDQLEHDSIEALVEGASSRRNQVLMDLGKEFGVPAIDGAHEVPLVELTAKLAERAPAYRYPGPILGAAVDTAVTAALGPRGSSASALGKRVSGHWGLGAGWAGRTALALALGTREGSSRRGGPLADLDASTADGLIDAAVSAAASDAGVVVAPPAPAAGGGAVDAAAVTELREHVEGILVGQASEVLARLGRMPVSEADQADHREALATLALLEAEHGPASLVAPAFDARRHVKLASGAAWARADVDHLVQAAWRASTGQAPLDREATAELIDQLAVFGESDPRVTTSLRHHRARAQAAGLAVAVEVLDQALEARPSGVAVAGLDELRGALTATGAAGVLDSALALVRDPELFAGQVAVVTGASPGSIAWAVLTHLLRGGATVVVVTTSDTPERIAAYRDLERRWAAPGAQLHVVPANLASFADIDALVEWITTPTTEAVGPVTREVKPALWPTMVLPFAAAPAAGELPDTREQAQLTLRLLLLGVQRLVGGLAERAATARRPRFTVVLPLSPNHGTFGGDGAYGEAKAALETMANRWRSESSRWGSQTRLVAAEIGWVRGTGLMAGNDPVADFVESELGVTTFASAQMGALIAGLAWSADRSGADDAPVRVDLSGGLAGRDDLAETLASAVTELTERRGALADLDDADPASTIPALPNLPEVLESATVPPDRPAWPRTPSVSARDMIVLVGIGEYGPWGGSSTRWQAELGAVSAAGVVELAWRTGLIRWETASGSWVDTASGDPVPESEVADRYRERVLASSGVRELEPTTGVAANGSVEFSEVFLDRPMTLRLPTVEAARAMAADVPGAVITQAEDGWSLTLPSGAAIRVPRTRPLRRSVGGQFPTGSDPTRLGLEPGVAASMDPLAAWNVVITAEALASAGVTAEELVSSVHPSLVGNTQGSGMGGMTSIHTMYMAPATGRSHPNDILQEALGNVVSAHVNQGLIGGYGPMVHPVAACATAAVSLEEAVDKIALGKAEIIIGGGWDDLGTEGINGFASMSATADNEAMAAAGLPPWAQSRPGDLRRRGFVEAQGGGTFLICRGSVALALGLPVRAVVGYAASFGDGIHTSIPAPGLGALGAVRGGADSPLARALGRLGLTAEDVAVVSKHDTSTDANDPNEAFIHARIAEELGRSEGSSLRVISQKSLTGHAKGGAAAWQIAGLCDVFSSGLIPGNHNLVSVDPRVTPDPLVVDYRTLHRGEPVRAALASSLGFGHVSAVVALVHPDAFSAGLSPDERDDYLARAHRRRVAGARSLLEAAHGGAPVLVRRTDRRLGEGTTQEQRDREAAMLTDAGGTLPGLTGAAG